MESPSECLAGGSPAGVESDGSTDAGEGAGEESPFTPSPQLRPPPGFRPRASPGGPGTRAPRRPLQDATPKSCSGETPASSSGTRPSSAQSTPVCAPPGLARPEHMLWSPFLGDMEGEMRSTYTPASASGEALPPLPLGGDAGPGWELPLLLGNKGESYTPGETLLKTSLLGTTPHGNDLSTEPCAEKQADEEAEEDESPQIKEAGERQGTLELGSQAMPTMGSAGHHVRACKPCAFVNTKGCKDGVNCKFCHLCEPGEKKRRKKEKKAFQRVVNLWHHGPAGTTPWDLANLQLHT